MGSCAKRWGAEQEADISLHRAALQLVPSEALGRRASERAWRSAHRLGRSHELDGVWGDGSGWTTGGPNQQRNRRAHGQAGDDYGKERDEVTGLAKMIEEGDGCAMVHGGNRPSPNERWSAAGQFALIPCPAAFGPERPTPAPPTAKLAAAARCAVTCARLWKRMPCSGLRHEDMASNCRPHGSRHAHAPEFWPRVAEAAGLLAQGRPAIIRVLCKIRAAPRTSSEPRRTASPPAALVGLA
jgi:hypothetical protein